MTTINAFKNRRGWCLVNMHVQLLIPFILISTKVISFSFILFNTCKGLRNGHNYLFIAEFIKRKIEGEETNI